MSLSLPNRWPALVLISAMISTAGCAAERADDLSTGALARDGEIVVVDAPNLAGNEIDEGRKHFAVGDYGLAERYFRKAVELDPYSTAAWVGLAASYDELKRFDLAERAYQKATALSGRTPELLNNLGYHYILRGKRKAARQVLNEAARMDPGNPQVQANLELLERH